jgi:crotonobetainyl-CoA:carnitine CoA-transferase CaiB-like acyl-CoA transferase
MATLDGRKRRENLIDDVISDWVKDRDAEALTALLQNAGVPAGRVVNSRQLLADRHLAAREFFVEFDEPGHGPKPYEGQSIPGNYVDKADWRHAHRLGQDTLSVLTDLLGYSDDECEALESEGTVGFDDEPPESTGGG